MGKINIEYIPTSVFFFSTIKLSDEKEIFLYFLKFLNISELVAYPVVNISIGHDVSQII